MQLLPNYPNCFICGTNSPNGIHATFHRQDKLVVSKCSFTKWHAGYKNIVHGGLIAALLDEAMGRSIAGVTRQFLVTGDLKIRYHNSIKVGTAVTVHGAIEDNQRHPKLFLQAWGKIFDDEQVYATAKAKFFPIPEEKNQQILDSLEIEGEKSKVTLEDI